MPAEQAAFGGGNTSGPRGGDAALAAHGHRIDFEVETFVVSDHAGNRRGDTPSLRAAGGDVGHGSEALVAAPSVTGGPPFARTGIARVEAEALVVSPVYAIQERAVSENIEAGPQGKGYQEDIAYTLEARNKVQGVVHPLSEPLEQRVVHALCGEGFDASEDGTGRGTPIIPVPFNITPSNSNKDWNAREATYAQAVTGGSQIVSARGGDVLDENVPTDPIAFSMRGREGGAVPEVEDGGVAPVVRTPGGGSSQTFIAFSSKDFGGDAVEDVSPTLRAGAFDQSHANAGTPPAVAFNARQDPISEEELSLPLDQDGSTVGVTDGGWRVRRLTPLECERLQGFPDLYTQIPNWDGWRDVGEDEDIEELRAAGLTVRKTKKGHRVNDPDGVRYKALGNSFAVNVVRWIGERIDLFERLVREGKLPPHPPINSEGK